jgi:hypothetical protein
MLGMEPRALSMVGEYSTTAIRYLLRETLTTVGSQALLGRLGKDIWGCVPYHPLLKVVANLILVSSAHIKLPEIIWPNPTMPFILTSVHIALCKSL